MSFLNPKLTDSNPKHRIKAIKKSKNIVELSALVNNDPNMEVRQAAANRVNEILPYVALNHESEEWRIAAIQHLSDEEVLTQVAIKDKNQQICDTAVRKISNENNLIKIALLCPHQAIVLYTVQKLKNSNKLNDVLTKHKDTLVKFIAFIYLTANKNIIDINKHFIPKQLIDIASLNYNEGVTREAIKYIVDEKTLIKLYQAQSDEQSRNDIIKKLSADDDLAILLDYTIKGSNKVNIIGRISDQDILIKLLHDKKHVQIHELIIRKINDKKVIADFIKNSDNQNAIREAVLMIEDQELLIKLAKENKDQNVKLSAISRITDENVLKEIAALFSDNEYIVSKIAVKCNDIEKINSLVAFAKDAKTRHFLFDHIKDDNTWVNFIVQEEDESYLLRAFKRLKSKKGLEEFALGGKTYFVRNLAMAMLFSPNEMINLDVTKVTNQHMLLDVINNDDNEWKVTDAINCLKDPEMLNQVIESKFKLFDDNAKFRIVNHLDNEDLLFKIFNDVSDDLKKHILSKIKNKDFIINILINSDNTTLVNDYVANCKDLNILVGLYSHVEYDFQRASIIHEIDDCESLRKFFVQEKDSELLEQIISKLNYAEEIFKLIPLVKSSEQKVLLLIQHIEDDDKLYDIYHKENRTDVKNAILSKLESNKILFEIYEKETDTELKTNIISELEDDTTRSRILDIEKDPDLQEKAFNSINDNKLLIELSTKFELKIDWWSDKFSTEQLNTIAETALYSENRIEAHKWAFIKNPSAEGIDALVNMFYNSTIDHKKRAAELLQKYAKNNPEVLLEHWNKISNVYKNHRHTDTNSHSDNHEDKYPDLYTERASSDCKSMHGDHSDHTDKGISYSFPANPPKL